MFTSIVRRLKRLNREETPPTAVEHIVLFVLIIVGCLVSIRFIATGTNESLESTADILKHETDDSLDVLGQ